MAMRRMTPRGFRAERRKRRALLIMIAYAEKNATIAHFRLTDT